MFLINLSGKETIFEQIKKQIIRFIELDILQADEKLPSCRQLANDLGINPNTVAKAYAELEKEGYIYTIQKKGVYVAAELNMEKELNDQARNSIQDLKTAGVSKNTLYQIIEEIYEVK